jgi:Tfp pilus assembly protein PilF
MLSGEAEFTVAGMDARIAEARNAYGSRDLQRAGAIADAILAAAPANLDAMEIKALVATERRDYAEAEQQLRSAIAHAPERRWHYADLTRLLLKVGRPADAEAVGRAALAHDPNNADAHAMLGSMLSERQAYVPAVAHLRCAIDLVGRRPELLVRLGRALMMHGDTDLARAALEEASAADPRMLLPVVSLAELEERAGRFYVASRLLDHAEPIARAAGTDVKLQRAALLERMGDIEHALGLLDAENELSGAALLHRGRLRDRLGRHDDAWSDWGAGKALLAKCSGRHYPSAEVRRQVDALARFFTRERFGALPRAARRADVPQPIFIVGFPRSGTTLTEQIVAGHSRVRAGGELPFATDMKDYLVSLTGGDFPNGLERLTSDDPHWPDRVRDMYLEAATSFGLTAADADYFTDKMPLNEMWLPLLRTAFPQSPVILVRRHPLDVLTSVMAHDMTHGFHCGYELTNAAHHLATIDDLTGRYRDQQIGVTCELRYESLVADPRGETQRLMDAIGLKLEPSQLWPNQRARVPATPSYAQVRKPIVATSVGRWSAHATQLEAVRSIVSDAMQRGGYND